MSLFIHAIRDTRYIYISLWQHITILYSTYHSYPFANGTHVDPLAHLLLPVSHGLDDWVHIGPYHPSWQMHVNVAPWCRHAPSLWHACRWHSLVPHWPTLRPRMPRVSCNGTTTGPVRNCTSNMHPWKPECNGKSCGNVEKLATSCPPKYRIGITSILARLPGERPVIFAPSTDNHACRPTRPILISNGIFLPSSRNAIGFCVKIRRGPEPKFHVSII